MAVAPAEGTKTIAECCVVGESLLLVNRARFCSPVFDAGGDNENRSCGSESCFVVFCSAHGSDLAWSARL